MRDASLDEFLSDPGEGSEADTEDEEHASDHGTANDPGPGRSASEPSEPGPDTEVRDGSENETEGPPPVADVDPARSTYAWSPDGAACAACGERVEERWEAETGLVCVACKEW